jgi:hypothetical protein
VVDFVEAEEIDKLGGHRREVGVIVVQEGGSCVSASLTDS